MAATVWLLYISRSKGNLRNVTVCVGKNYPTLCDKRVPLDEYVKPQLYGRSFVIPKKCIEKGIGIPCAA